MELPKKIEWPEVLYDAVPEEDAPSIEESGHIPPDEHGFVLLSTDRDAGIKNLIAKGHDYIALFQIDPQWLDSDRLEQMSDSSWYLYGGEVQGAEFIDFYGPPPPALAAALRDSSSRIEKLLSTLPLGKREVVRQMLLTGVLVLDQAAIDAIAGSLIADMDLDFGEEEE